MSMDRTIRVRDAVALLQDLPEAQLQRGEVGTVVEALAPDVYEVELSDDRGWTYASLSIAASHLLPLVYKESAAAS
jgi:hypothetical protein